MPTVAELPGKIRVMQYYAEHPPPHFHAFQGEDEVLLQIDDLAICRGALAPAALRSVRAWAHIHRTELRANWTSAEANGPMQRIPSP